MKTTRLQSDHVSVCNSCIVLPTVLGMLKVQYTVATLANEDRMGKLVPLSPQDFAALRLPMPYYGASILNLMLTVANASRL